MSDQENQNGAQADPSTERIAKALARAGVGSRRDVERMIEAGRIKIDGKTLTTPAVLVSSLAGITVDGQPVQAAEPPRLWRYHKPRGLLTTHRDPEGRATVFDHLPKNLPRVIAVGRLDLNTEGLLLLTNDGGLARWLELPSTGWVRTYRVRVHGAVKENALDRLKDGITVDGTQFGPIDAKLERTQGANAWVTVSLAEGKNREVRRVMEHLGLSVNRLIRTHYGPFGLTGLERGHVAPVSFAALEEHLKGYLEALSPKSQLAPSLPDRSKWAKPKPKPKRPGQRKRRPQPDDNRSTPKNADRAARPRRGGSRKD